MQVLTIIPRVVASRSALRVLLHRIQVYPCAHRHSDHKAAFRSPDIGGVSKKWQVHVEGKVKLLFSNTNSNVCCTASGMSPGGVDHQRNIYL